MDSEVEFDDNPIFEYTNHTQLTTSPSRKEPILDAQTEFITDIVFFVILCVLVCVFGTITNVINVIVYFRLGILSTSSNLNLFSLAVADLGVSFTTLLHAVGFAVILADLRDLTWDPFAIVYLAVGWPTMIFIMTNRTLTAYVAFERCLCVVLPFHIRSMFTIKRSMFYIITIYAYTFLSHVPIYIIHRLEFHKQEATNVSKLVLIHTADREIVHAIVFYSNSFGVTMATVVIVFVCTLITSTRIKTSKEWRKSVSVQCDSDRSAQSCQSPNKEKSKEINDKNSKTVQMSDETIDRETRLIKMITTVSVIYLVCYIPEVLLIVMKAVEDEIRLTGAYYRLAKLVYSFTFVSSGVNSSVNIFIYYKMSSRYRNEFLKLFGFTEKEKRRR